MYVSVQRHGVLTPHLVAHSSARPQAWTGWRSVPRRTCWALSSVQQKSTGACCCTEPGGRALGREKLLTHCAAPSTCKDIAREFRERVQRSTDEAELLLVLQVRHGVTAASWDHYLTWETGPSSPPPGPS